MYEQRTCRTGGTSSASRFEQLLVSTTDVFETPFRQLLQVYVERPMASELLQGVCGTHLDDSSVWRSIPGLKVSRIGEKLFALLDQDGMRTVVEVEVEEYVPDVQIWLFF